MKIAFETTETVKYQHEIEVSEYFTTLSGWFYRVLPNGKLMQVTEFGVGIYPSSAVDHLTRFIKPCTQDEFVAAYCTAINRISQASGIEHLPLQMELIDNTQNPES